MPDPDFNRNHVIRPVILIVGMTHVQEYIAASGEKNRTNNITWNRLCHSSRPQQLEFYQILQGKSSKNKQG
jgi:hypothetical protein